MTKFSRKDNIDRQKTIAYAMEDSKLNQILKQSHEICDKLQTLGIKEYLISSEIFEKTDGHVASDIMMTKLRETSRTLKNIKQNINLKLSKKEQLNQFNSLAKKSEQSNVVDFVSLGYHGDAMANALEIIKTAEKALEKEENSFVTASNLSSHKWKKVSSKFS